jgi:hypothetical protein
MDPKVAAKGVHPCPLLDTDIWARDISAPAIIGNHHNNNNNNNKHALRFYS